MATLQHLYEENSSPEVCVLGFTPRSSAFRLLKNARYVPYRYAQATVPNISRHVPTLFMTPRSGEGEEDGGFCDSSIHVHLDPIGLNSCYTSASFCFHDVILFLKRPSAPRFPLNENRWNILPIIFEPPST
jgi:hypothetical protein